jgi:hypothetical protein
LLGTFNAASLGLSELYAPAAFQEADNGIIKVTGINYQGVQTFNLQLQTQTN